MPSSLVAEPDVQHFWSQNKQVVSMISQFTSSLPTSVRSILVLSSHDLPRGYFLVDFLNKFLSISLQYDDHLRVILFFT
jgi:hypothetical protein